MGVKAGKKTYTIKNGRVIIFHCDIDIENDTSNGRVPPAPKKGGTPLSEPLENTNWLAWGIHLVYQILPAVSSVFLRSRL